MSLFNVCVLYYYLTIIFAWFPIDTVSAKVCQTDKLSFSRTAGMGALNTQMQYTLTQALTFQPYYVAGQTR